jgi:hypothetical protein
MCYGAPTAREWAPEPAEDPGRYRLKDRNLSAVVGNYHQAGARRLIVSGVVDPVRGVDAHLSVTPCRLRCDPAELRRRLAGRGRPNEQVDEILEYAAAMDRFPGACIDSTGRNVADTVQLVRLLTAGDL